MNQRFIRAVEAIYDAAPAPALWPNALQAIADIFDDVGAVLIYSRDDSGFGAIVSDSLIPLVRDFMREFNGQDIRAIRGRERGYFLGRDASTDRDVVTDEEMETHPYYKMLARHGLKYFAAAPVSPDPRVLGAISIQRAIDRKPYADEELDIVAQIALHAEKALRLSIRLLDAELTKVGLGEALGRLSIGIFALDSMRRVTLSNAAADRLLGDGLLIVDGQLRIGPTPAREEINRTIALALGGDPAFLAANPKPLLVEQTKSTRPLTLYVLPARGDAGEMSAVLTHTRAIVLVIDPDAAAPPDPSLVRDVLGLTLGEARIASLVGSGLPPREAADRLGIAEETARTALKRVFAKTGVSRQSELAALLTRLVLR